MSYSLRALEPANAADASGLSLFELDGKWEFNRRLNVTARAAGGSRAWARNGQGVRIILFDFAGDVDGAEACTEEAQELARDVAGLDGHQFRAVVVAGEPYHEMVKDTA